MMKGRPLSPGWWQVAVWLMLTLLYFLSLLQYDPPFQAMVYTLITIGFYLAIIYTNVALLLPQLYEKGHKALYVITAIVFLAGITIFRYWFNLYVYNSLFAGLRKETFRWQPLATGGISAVMVFLSSVLLYMALRYFRIRQVQKELQKKHAEAELNLLKAQVQPHFLFNTLNNIYFIAQRESPATAAMIEKLSQIMRYFTEEAHKQEILLQREIDFVNDYISLELMRMRYPPEVLVSCTGINADDKIPPMLLVPLVENVFKHGMDKLRKDNFITVIVQAEAGKIRFEVINRYSSAGEKEEIAGSGTRNLRSRLHLLYSGQAHFDNKLEEDHYHAILTIPYARD